MVSGNLQERIRKDVLASYVAEYPSVDLRARQGVSRLGFIFSSRMIPLFDVWAALNGKVGPTSAYTTGSVFYPICVFTSGGEFGPRALFMRSHQPESVTANPKTQLELHSRRDELRTTRRHALV